MKILHLVQFYSPAVGGMEESVRQISEALVKLGHDVTVATSYHNKRENLTLNNVKIKQFKISGNMVNGIKGDTNQFLNFLKSNQFDIISVFAAQQWTADLFFDVTDQIQAKKIFIPTGFSALYLSQYQSYFEKMKKWILKFDHCIFLSSNYRDINFAKEIGIKNYSIIPNGASLKEFATLPQNSIQNPHIILTVGNHTGQKGHSEAMLAYNQIALKDQSELIIVGRKNLRDRCFFSCHLKAIILNFKFFLLQTPKKIKIKSLSREELLHTYKTCHCFWLFSNIECSPIVLFEAAAAGKPFVSINVGNAIEISQWTESGHILPTFLNKVGQSKLDLNKAILELEKLMNNDAQLLELGAKGRKNWLEKFTWENIAKQYETIYEK